MMICPSLKKMGFFVFGATLIIAQGCSSRDEGTSRSGPSNQTVDSEFRVHRDKDGSVTGQPGISPYEGRINPQQAGIAAGVDTAPKANAPSQAEPKASPSPKKESAK